MTSQVDWPDCGSVVPDTGPINGFQVLERIAGLPIST